MPSYPYNLGNYSWKIKAVSKTAQRWFDPGIIWTYGFHHKEAQVCFERALKEDPKRAMAYWVLAYIAGSNYNRSWETFGACEAKAILNKCRENLTFEKIIALKKVLRGA